MNEEKFKLFEKKKCNVSKKSLNYKNDTCYISPSIIKNTSTLKYISNNTTRVYRTFTTYRFPCDNRNLIIVSSLQTYGRQRYGQYIILFHRIALFLKRKFREKNKILSLTMDVKKKKTTSTCFYFSYNDLLKKVNIIFRNIRHLIIFYA